MKPFEYGLYKPNETLLIVIDVQEKLTPLMSDEAGLIKNVNTLLKGAEILGIPTLITEQYPKGLGTTDKRIEFGNLGRENNKNNENGENNERSENQSKNLVANASDKAKHSVAVLEKTSFSIFGNDKIIEFIAQLNAQGGARNLIICGIESHICVLASVLHALQYPLESRVAQSGVNNDPSEFASGFVGRFKVWVAQDALSSRTKANHLNAIELMRNKGANISCVESLLFGAMLESKNEYFKQISALIK